jgi:formyltetrahydrofolate synthetase
MGTLIISLSDETEKKLREIVREMYGSSKGAISKVVEDALKNYFFIPLPENSLL